MSSNKMLYFFSFLIIAAIAALLIWATAAGDGGTSDAASDISRPAQSVGGSLDESSSQGTSGISGIPSSGGDDESESGESSTTDPEESYADRVGKEYAIDITPYLQYIVPEETEEYLLLVNPENLLPSDYVPGDLVNSIHTRDDGRDPQQMRLYAAKALEAFLAEAAEYGVTDVSVTSAYRSYAYQGWLFNYYCEQEQAKDPSADRATIEARVLTYSMKAGMSEHQSGLCTDMHNLGAADTAFGDTSEAKWLAENAHRFGFILRYPADKTGITGVQYEPWHFRFVGREAATEIYEQGLCLEEYIASLEGRTA